MLLHRHVLSLGFTSLLTWSAAGAALADATLTQLNDEANRRTLTEIFTEMHHVLKQNTAQRAAEVVTGIIEARKERR